MKSERLKKLEHELEDLEQWLSLSLVPKSDIKKHKEEINSIKQKINEEINRINSLKENGNIDEYIAPKRTQQGKQAYQEPSTMPGMDIDENEDTSSDDKTFIETETYETYSTKVDIEEETEEDNNPFSDKNRWKRGIMEDPYSDH